MGAGPVSKKSALSKEKRSAKPLDVNRETIQDLSEGEAEGVAGGLNAGNSHHVCPPAVTSAQDKTCHTLRCLVVTSACPLTTTCPKR